MVTELLATDYHQQDTDYYCGAACAQMTLDSIGAGILDQVGLYNANHAHSLIETNWYTGPDGLTWTLNGRLGGQARLVWAPSRQSASMLYPLWEVRDADEEEPPVFVDLAGRVWPAIEPGGPGG